MKLIIVYQGTIAIKDKSDKTYYLHENDTINIYKYNEMRDKQILAQNETIILVLFASDFEVIQT